MSNSKKNKESKLTTKKKSKKNNNKLAYYAVAAGLASLAGLGFKNFITSNNKMSSKSTDKPMLTMEHISQKDFLQLKEYLAKEQEANKKLVNHINLCNKEVIRLQGLLSKKSSLHKEVLLRNTIKKLTQNKKL